MFRTLLYGTAYDNKEFLDKYGYVKVINNSIYQNIAYGFRKQIPGISIDHDRDCDLGFDHLPGRGISKFIRFCKRYDHFQMVFHRGN